MNKPKPFLNNKKTAGFTLIELLVVIAIVGLLASITLVAVTRARERAKTAKGLQFGSSIHHALGAYAGGVWDFNTGSGSVAVDSSGNENDGTFAGDVSWTTDTPSGKGFALSFDGNGDFVNVTDDPSISGGAGKSMTVTAWFKLNSSGLMQQIVNKYQNGEYKDYALAISSANVLAFIYENQAGGCLNPPVITADTSLSTGTWYHGAFSFDVSDHSLKLYLNGTLDGQATTLNNCDLCDGNTKLAIGSRSSNSMYGPGEYLNGSIDEVHIYEEALTSAQIKKLYVEGAKKKGLLAEE